MNKQETGAILDLMDTYYPNKLKVTNEEVFFNSWFAILQEYEYNFVAKNLKNHIMNSPFVPSVHDLITDKTKQPIEGRYVPDARTTYIEMQQKEQERQLALTTTTQKVRIEQIHAAKEKALKTIANAVKRSEEENPYKVVD